MAAAPEMVPDPPPTTFVAHSEIRVPTRGVADLLAAFRDRLGEVDGWPGFARLEVWQDERDPERFVMVSWWDSHECFSEYMRSQSHRRSHARIPAGPDAPKAASFARFTVVAR
jgi:heme-degrading monooxygenase HmoA